jgi:hypothetical protein
MADDTVTPVGFEKLAVSSTAVAFASVPARATSCLLVCETNAVRFRSDGTNPTATDGVPIAAGQPLTYNGDPSALKFIRQSADATIQAEFYE